MGALCLWVKRAGTLRGVRRCAVSRHGKGQGKRTPKLASIGELERDDVRLRKGGDTDGHRGVSLSDRRLEHRHEGVHVRLRAGRARVESHGVRDPVVTDREGRVEERVGIHAASNRDSRPGRAGDVNVGVGGGESRRPNIARQGYVERPKRRGGEGEARRGQQAKVPKSALDLERLRVCDVGPHVDVVVFFAHQPSLSRVRTTPPPTPRSGYASPSA